jgi:hypothetical protein
MRKYIALIIGGIRPEDWQMIFVIKAENILEAADTATALANKFDGLLVNIESSDYTPVNMNP